MQRAGRRSGPRWPIRASSGNFVELRRVSGELAAVDQAIAGAEEAWLEMEEAAP